MFKIKRDVSNRTVCFKACLVAKGFSQCKDESYDKIFSLVVNFMIIRLFFADFVSYFKWEHCQLDIKNAYLYAPLRETIYTRQSQGFINIDTPNHISLLTLYGLHQSVDEWFYEIGTLLQDLDFEKFSKTN